jgi:hypothetical protein
MATLAGGDLPAWPLFDTVVYRRTKMNAQHKLTDEQITKILDRLVPLIAKPEDHGFFRGILFIKAQESSSSQFAAFIHKLLNAPPTSQLNR